MVSVGIDAGTGSYGVYLLETEEHFEFQSEWVRENPERFVEFLNELDMDAGAGLSGYGLPVKRFSEISNRDFFEMTLNFEKERAMGMRAVIEAVKKYNIPLFTIPAVIHLPTVPEHRKINRIDMGTYDKVCSVAHVLYEYGIDQTFVLAELGYGFNGFIAVREGKVVDGIGGTSGFPAYRSISAIDGELAYLLKSIEKKILFMGGLKSYFEDAGIDFDAEIFSEWVLKGINAVNTSVKADRVYISGRFAPAVSEIVGREYDVVNLSREDAKISACGAAVIASGYAGGDGKEVTERLELLKARGSVFDHITSDIKTHLRVDNYF